MATLTQTFEGGTAGTEISSSNTTGGGSAIASVKGTGSSVAFTSTAGEVINGSFSCKCNGPSGSAAYVNWSGSTTTGGFFVKHRLPVVTANGSVQIIRGTSGVMAQVQLTTANKLSFQSVSGTLFTTTALTLPGVYFIDMGIDSGTGTTDGKFKFAVYDASGNFAGGMTAVQEFTATNTGAGTSILYFQAGKCNTITDTSNYILDDMNAITGAYTLGQPITSTSTVRPTSLVSNPGAWTYYGSGITSAYGGVSDQSDATGIRSVDTPSSAAITLGNSGVLGTGNVTVKVRAHYVGTSGTVQIQLLTSTGTVVSTGTAQALSGTLSTYQLTLSGAENATLNTQTLRTGLQVVITGTAV